MTSRSLELRKHADKSGPEPARNDPDADGILPDPARPPGVLLESWPLDHVELRSDPPKKHWLSDKFVLQAITEGWASMDTEAVTLHLVRDGKDVDVVYHILERPGTYCEGCGEAFGEGHRIHAPDDGPPYRITHEYQLQLVNKKGA